LFRSFRGSLERSDFTHADDVTAVPFHPELEVLVWIKPLWINAELCHGMILRLGFDLSRELLDLDDDEFGRFEGGEADEDVDDAAIDIVLRRRFGVALN